ncbi:MAG: hypothetical protein AAF487_11375 [Bacteroidota bacterium]
MTTDYHFNVLILTDSEVILYNFLFAIIAVVFGHSICMQYWINRPKRSFLKYRKFSKRILFENRFYAWMFLYWFSDLAIIYGLWLYKCWPHDESQLSFSILEIIAFIVSALVVFQISRLTINRILKKKGTRQTLALTLILSLTAWAISQINLIDYKAINASILSNNIAHEYDIQLPKTDYLDYFKRYELQIDLFLTIDQNEPNNEPILILD